MLTKPFQGGGIPLEESYEPSKAEKVYDYSDLIETDCFLGEVPFDTIIECIENQFDDYINNDDSTNYVDIFYTQLENSRRTVESDDNEVHIQEIKEALDKIEDKFNSFMQKEFTERLTLSITVLEDEDPTNDDVEFIFRKLYEFFILNAKKNFRDIIEKDMIKRLPQGLDDKTFFREIEKLMILYSPLITSIKPDEFIKLREDPDLQELFDNGEVSGNFLRKYSPKFYQNDEFKVEVINYVTMCAQFGRDITNGE